MPTGEGRPWEILLPIRRDGGETLRSQLTAGLREAVKSGALGPGARLPSTRALAQQLRLSRGVVVDVYDQLAREGVVELRPRVAPRIAPDVQPGRLEDITGSEPPAPRFDFSVTSPDLALFPRSAWRRAMDAVLRELPDRAFDYEDHRGALALRLELSRYLRRVRGVAATPDTTVIVNGFTQGLDLLCRVLAAGGARTVAIEDPCLEDEPMACERAGLRIERLPVDGEGARVGSVRHADAVFVSPSHQYPTGTVLSEARRHALLDWARDRDRLVVEDDYDAEFRYGRDPLGSLQGMLPERVVYTGTASKTFAPGLRLGWLVCPEALAHEVAELKWYVDGGSPALEQHVYARLLGDGTVDRHLQRVRAYYSARRQAFVGELERAFPDARIVGVPAGLHLLLQPGYEVDDERLAEAAAAGAIRVELVRAHAHDPPLLDGLMLGYGSIPTPAIAEATAALVRAVEAARR